MKSGVAYVWKNQYKSDISWWLGASPRSAMRKCGVLAAAQCRACGRDTGYFCSCADKTAGDERARQQLLQRRCNLWKNNTGEYFYDIGSGPSYGAHPCFQSRVIYQEKTLNRY